MIILGIDPGAVSTGLALMDAVVRGKPRLLGSATVTRSDRGYRDLGALLPVSDGYLEDVQMAADALGALVASIEYVAVEGVVRPTWAGGLRGRAAANPEPLLATAVVLGYVKACFPPGLISPTLVEVRPGGNGGGPLGSYPEALVSDREKSAPAWQTRVGGEQAKLRHERSAWDVALVASRLPELRPRQRTVPR
jgi:hypothetical protein